MSVFLHWLNKTHHRHFWKDLHRCQCVSVSQTSAPVLVRCQHWTDAGSACTHTLPCRRKDILRTSPHDSDEVPACSVGDGNSKDEAETSTINPSVPPRNSYDIGTPRKGRAFCCSGLWCWPRHLVLHPCLGAPAEASNVKLRFSVGLWLPSKISDSQDGLCNIPAKLIRPLDFKYSKIFWIFITFFEWWSVHLASLLALGGACFFVEAVLQNQLC